MPVQPDQSILFIQRCVNLTYEHEHYRLTFLCQPITHNVLQAKPSCQWQSSMNDDVQSAMDASPMFSSHRPCGVTPPPQYPVWLCWKDRGNNNASSVDLFRTETLSIGRACTRYSVYHAEVHILPTKTPNNRSTTLDPPYHTSSVAPPP